MIYKPSLDFGERAREIEQDLRAKPEKLAIYRRVIERVDAGRVAALQLKYRDDFENFDPVGRCKYADLPFWIADKINTVIGLDLHRGAPKSILDIGMGGGHFGAICQALGHRVVGTDKNVPLYNDICEVFGLDRRILPTKLRVPMRDLGEKFDLVVVIGQLFNVIRPVAGGPIGYWTTEDWAFFLKDLIVGHMRYPGSIFLHLNPNLVANGTQRDQGLLQWTRDHGAIADDVTNKVLFSAIDGWETLEAAARSRSAGGCAPASLGPSSV